MPLINEGCCVPDDTEKKNVGQESDKVAACGIDEVMHESVYRKKYNEHNAINTSDDVTGLTGSDYNCQMSGNSSVIFGDSSQRRFQNCHYSSDDSSARVEGEVRGCGTYSDGSDYNCQMSKKSSVVSGDASTRRFQNCRYSSEESLARVEGQVRGCGTYSDGSDYNCQMSRNSSVVSGDASTRRFQNCHYSSEESLARVEGEVRGCGTFSDGSDYNCQMSKKSSVIFGDASTRRFQNCRYSSEESLARVEGEVRGCCTYIDGSDDNCQMSRNSSLLFEKSTLPNFQNRCNTSKKSPPGLEDAIHLYGIDDDATRFYDGIKQNSVAVSEKMHQIGLNHGDACEERQGKWVDNDKECETVHICTTKADIAIRCDSRVQYPIINTSSGHDACHTGQTSPCLKMNQAGSHVINMLDDRQTWYDKLPAYVDPFKPLAKKQSQENHVIDGSDKNRILTANHSDCEKIKVKECPEETCIMLEGCKSGSDEKRKKKWLKPVLITLGATSASILVSAMTLLMMVHL